MGNLECVICRSTEDEAEHMIGVEFNAEDHGDREDVALCDDCVIEAYNILQTLKLRTIVQEEFSYLQIKE